MNPISFLPVDSIKPFHAYPFRLYEGKREMELADSITKHGILVPIIAHQTKDGYEMLSGHNRQNIARLLGIKEIPAIVKVGLSEEEAYTYVIESNIVQRTFAQLLPSEKAMVMKYKRRCEEEKRREIIWELELLNGKQSSRFFLNSNCERKNRESMAEEYGISGRNTTRYLRLNELIEPLLALVDYGRLGVVSAVELSYLTEQEQMMVWETLNNSKIKITPKKAKELRKHTGNMTREIIEKIIGDGINVKLPNRTCEKYFKGMNTQEMAVVVEQALADWFQY